jgi:PAS domain S-box-containing protein
VGETRRDKMRTVGVPFQTNIMEEKLSKFIEQAPVGIITFSSDGVIDYVNQNFHDFSILYELETTSLLGKNIFSTDIFPSTKLTDELNELTRGFPFEKELKHIHTRDGREITLIVKGSPFSDNENLIGGILLIEDIKVLITSRQSVQFKTEYIEKAIEKVNDFLIVINPEGDVRYSTGNIFEKIGLRHDDISGKNTAEIFNHKIDIEIKDAINKIVESKEHLFKKLDIEYKADNRIFECRFEPMLNSYGQVRYLYLFFNDKTDEITSTTTLNEQVTNFAYYKTASEKLNQALITINNDGNIIYWDKQSEQIFGLSANQVIGKFIGEVFEAFTKDYFTTLRTDIGLIDYHKVNVNFFDDDHQKRSYEFRFVPAISEGEEIIIQCVEITDILKEKDEIVKSESSLQKIIANTDEFILISDSTGHLEFLNSNFMNLLEITHDEMKELHLDDLLPPETYKDKRIVTLDELLNKTKEKIKISFLTKSGATVHLNGTFKPVSDEKTFSRKYIGYFGEVKESNIPESETTIYSSVFGSSLDGMAVASDGKILIANDAFASIFGFDLPADIENKDLLDFVSNNDILRVAEFFRLKERNKFSPERFDFLAKKKDNSLFYCELTISTFKKSEKTYLTIMTRDVTERKRSQRAIKESEEKYRNITENIDDFLFTFERSGRNLRPLFYTVAVEKITGYSQADFLSDTKLFLKVIHPDDFSMLKKKMSVLMKNRIQSSGEFEFRIINKHGNIVWIRNKVNLVRNLEGDIQKVYGLVSDITLKKRAEEDLKQSAESLKKLNETKDRFISIVSHDLRTPFSSILGFTDLLSSDESLSDEERKQYVKYIQESSKSMLALVNSLLDWTRLQTGRIKFEPQKIEARLIVEKSINTISGTAFQKGIRILSTVGDEYHIFVDKNLIHQVFNNLISNAIKFTDKGGMITISVKPSSSIRFIEFTVKDNGRGIKQENIEKLFNVDSKFSSEGTAGERGSGLGLSLVKEIVEKHGGTINVQSNYGEGSEFKFTLPIASENILIVDSNKTDRILYSKILKNITPDYSVDIASNGKEALEKIASSPPALIITEHLMPEMNGYEFVKELIKSEAIKTSPVIVLSSSIDRNSAADYTELGIEYVFQKPVDLRNFKQSVEKSLRKGMTSSR